MDFFIIAVGILMLLASVDLIVGVSNDAVNFLNSAIGSKVATYRTIIIIAMMGIIIGSVFSSGIMEVARKGVFSPQFFTFDIIMIIFLAVMLTDILLLDVFNSLGMPTSTTVSIVFELLGASLMAGVLFTITENEAISEIWKYINFESVKNIVSGIFLSVLIAFTAGVAIQYLCRLLFSFQYEKKLNKYGAIYSGIGITSIVYFLLIKGLKGTTIINDEMKAYIHDHTWLILGILFVISFIVLIILQRVWKVNPLKMVVLLGTFALAMAFAGNDLVNFIGVPITGLLSYQDFIANANGLSADKYYMGFLAGNSVKVPNYLLLTAGVIMALTIWLSAKAKKVTETEINLGRQSEGAEKFKPNVISRRIVNSTLVLSKVFGIIIPTSVVERYNTSLEEKKLKEAVQVHETPAFDLVRAATNLIVAAIIISWATSEHLPLSTTYVSFMVAMGSSLADKAWGRESAVYRVAGVLSVIGGWFMTAGIAFSVAAIFTAIMYEGGRTGTYVLIGLVFAFIIVSQITFNKKEKHKKNEANRLVVLHKNDLNTVEKYKKLVGSTISEIASCYNNTLEGLIDGDLVKLEKANQTLINLEEHSKEVTIQSIRYLKNLKTDDKKTAQVIVLSSDFIQDLTQSTKFLSDECLYFTKNLHEVNNKKFLENLKELDKKMYEYFNLILVSLEQTEFENFDHIKEERNKVRSYINENLDFQIHIINKDKPTTKEGILQTNVFLQSRDIQAVLTRISKMFLKLYEKRINTITGPDNE